MKSQIDPEKSYWADFNCFQFKMPGQCVLDCSHSGECYYDCENWIEEIKKGIEELYKDDPDNPWKPTKDKIRKELDEYGCWDDEELNNENENWIRIIWEAANRIKEEDEPDYSEPVK